MRLLTTEDNEEQDLRDPEILEDLAHPPGPPGSLSPPLPHWNLRGKLCLRDPGDGGLLGHRVYPPPSHRPPPSRPPPPPQDHVHGGRLHHLPQGVQHDVHR